MKNKIKLYSIIIILNLLISSCSLYIDSFTNNLNSAIMSSNDPQTIMQALPAYIVLLDGLLEGDPNNRETLMASVKLMNAYSSLLGSQVDIVDNLPEYEIARIEKQQKLLNKKALERANKAICIYKEIYCKLTKIKYTELNTILNRINDEDAKALYKLTTAWVAWIQVNTDDWNAMAQIAQIKLLLQTIVEHDETIDNGNAHVYLGVLNSIIPATLGGKPDLGKKHFEKAISLSNNKNLMAKALYAEYYSRLIFDEKLHNRLISEILTEKNASNDLINTLAVEKARALQRSAEDYF